MLKLIPYILIGIFSGVLWLISSVYTRSSGGAVLSLICYAMIITYELLTQLNTINSIIVNNFVALLYCCWVTVMLGLGILSYSDYPLALTDYIYFMMIGLVFVVDVKNPKFVFGFDVVLSFIIIVAVITGTISYLHGGYDIYSISRFEVSSGRAGIINGLCSLSFYLILKYTPKPSIFMLVGFIGCAFYTYTNIITAFRGCIIISAATYIMISLALIIRWKMNLRSMILQLTSISILVLAILYGGYKFINDSSSIQLITTRFETLFDGGLMHGISKDPRFLELIDARDMLTSWHSIFGYGMGSTWISSFVFGNSPIRTMLHVNIAYYIFKIGYIGLFLYLFALAFKVRKEYKRIGLTWTYCAFIILWFLDTLYYGYKTPVPWAIIYFIILVNPSMFILDNNGHKITPFRPSLIRKSNKSH